MIDTFPKPSYNWPQQNRAGQLLAPVGPRLFIDSTGKVGYHYRTTENETARLVSTVRPFYRGQRNRGALT
jgi:hypothetical protein